MTPQELLDLDSERFRNIVDRDVRHGQRGIEQLDDETRRSLRSPEVVGRWSELLNGIVAQFHRQQEAAASERAARIASSEVSTVGLLEKVMNEHSARLTLLLEELNEQVRQNKRIRAVIERHRSTVQGDESIEPSVADYELWNVIAE